MAESSDASSGERGSSEVECRQIAELLADYLEGTLPNRLMELIEWHIDGCGPCVAFVNTYRGTVKATGSLPPAAIPPELKKRLLTVLKATMPADHRRVD
jgi:hypothetical protein